MILILIWKRNFLSFLNYTWLFSWNFCTSFFEKKFGSEIFSNTWSYFVKFWSLFLKDRSQNNPYFVVAWQADSNVQHTTFCFQSKSFDGFLRKKINYRPISKKFKSESQALHEIFEESRFQLKGGGAFFLLFEILPLS